MERPSTLEIESTMIVFILATLIQTPVHVLIVYGTRPYLDLTERSRTLEFAEKNFTD